jgi:uncharacterized protein (DUF4415 family)
MLWRLTRSILPPSLRRGKRRAKGLKKQVTLRLSVDVIAYFKALAAETGIPYQNLINLYLRECAQTRKKPALSWAS